MKIKSIQKRVSRARNLQKWAMNTINNTYGQIYMAPLSGKVKKTVIWGLNAN